MENLKNVLISRSENNSEYAEQLKQRLEAEGFNIKDSALDECIDRLVKKQKLASGESEELKALLQECIDWTDTLVVIVDKEISNDSAINVETELANQKGKNIVAVLMPECDDNDLPEGIKDYVSGSIVTSENSEIVDIIGGKKEVWQNADGSTRTTPLTVTKKRRNC